MPDRRLNPRRQNSAFRLCLIMIGIAVAITFAVARLRGAYLIEVEELRIDATHYRIGR